MAGRAVLGVVRATGLVLGSVVFLPTGHRRSLDCLLERNGILSRRRSYPDLLSFSDFRRSRWPRDLATASSRRGLLSLLSFPLFAPSFHPFSGSAPLLIDWYDILRGSHRSFRDRL